MGSNYWDSNFRSDNFEWMYATKPHCISGYNNRNNVSISATGNNYHYFTDTDIPTDRYTNTNT